MWRMCLVLAVALAPGPAGGPGERADAPPESELGDGWPAGPAGPFELFGPEMRLAARVAARWGVRGPRGEERLRAGALELHRNWAGRPDSTSSLGFDLQGPRLPGGMRPSVGLARGFSRAAASPSGAGRAFRDSWRLGLAGPRAGAAATLRQGGVRRWSVQAGDAPGPLGSWRLTRVRGASDSTGSVQVGWVLARGGSGVDAAAPAGPAGGAPRRLELAARLAPRDGAVRASLAHGARRLELEVRSLRARNSVPATLARAGRPGVPSQGRVTVRAADGRWRAGVGLGLRGDSLGGEAFAARALAGRAGRLEVSGGLRVSAARPAQAPGGLVSEHELRAHAAFQPRARWGPARPFAGAGVAWRRAGARGRVRAEGSGGVALRWRGLGARLGWEVSPAGLRVDGSPALAGRVEARPGPLEVSAALRPTRSGLRWSATAEWKR
ncbi:MAG TPA: hypothetical protein VMS93_06945 [Candidatus Saccharimonadales bacterium]|nr:hypothetical protein [Candidatus Saccharimonadales bacterium]